MCAGAGKAGLHLIRDHHDAVVVAQLADGADQVGGGGVEATFALHGFKDDGGDAGGVKVGLEQLGDARHRVGGGDAVDVLREGHVVDIGHHGAEALFVGIDLAGQRHAQKGAAVEGAAKGDDGVAARGDAGDFDGVFNGFGAGGDEDGFLREIAGDSGVQAFGQADVVFIGQDLMAGMGEARQLLGDGGHDAGVAMAGVDHGDTGGKVDIAVALDIPDLGVQGAVDVDLGLHADAAGNGIGAAAGDIGVFHG